MERIQSGALLIFAQLESMFVGIAIILPVHHARVAIWTVAAGDHVFWLKTFTLDGEPYCAKHAQWDPGLTGPNGPNWSQAQVGQTDPTVPTGPRRNWAR